MFTVTNAIGLGASAIVKVDRWGPLYDSREVENECSVVCIGGRFGYLVDDSLGV